MNEPVLVLNRNFEPINVCNTRRAVGLLMVGKAEMSKMAEAIFARWHLFFRAPS